MQEYNQAPNAILMIRPRNFGYNPDTAASNAFQVKDDVSIEFIRERAVYEFDVLVGKIRLRKVNVIVIDDTQKPVKPDAVFSNNWISTHHDGSIFFYPMFAPSRRGERRSDVLTILQTKFGYDIKHVYDLSWYEENKMYLEGTGSVVFDYANRKAYASLSSRTDTDVLERVCEILNFDPVVFCAKDTTGNDIYHTNVLMCLGDQFSVICLECIPDIHERDKIRQTLEQTGHEIIELYREQLTAFAGNMIQLMNKDNRNIVVMSDSAYNALSNEQIERLEQYGDLLHSNLETIERYGGGSARCMITGIFLPRM